MKEKHHIDISPPVPYVAFGMEWAKPEYERYEVDAAGVNLIDTDAAIFERIEAVDIVNNWRSAHYFPLNAIQIGLRQKARQIKCRCLVAQRIKRRAAIEEKLRRLTWLSLSDMQDIGGCRAVVWSVRRVNDLVKTHKSSRSKHELIHEDDYIAKPKRSGYRSHHLIYHYGLHP